MEDIDLKRPRVTIAQAVERSGLSRSYFALLMRKGRLEGFRLGHDWFIYADSLEVFLSSERKSGPHKQKENNP